MPCCHGEAGNFPCLTVSCMHELTLIASVDGTSGATVLPVGLVGGVKRGR